MAFSFSTRVPPWTEAVDVVTNSPCSQTFLVLSYDCVKRKQSIVKTQKPQQFK